MLARFGIVGVGATLLHVAVFAAIIELLMWDEMVANTLAFLVAFSLSFAGHFGWTFANLPSDVRRSAVDALPRFLAVSLLGFALNSLAVGVFARVLNFPYLASVGFMIFVTPLVVFLASRFWAFGTARGSEAR